MLIEVNGEPQRVTAGTTIEQLLRQMEIVVSHVAVERNRELVPREQHHATTLVAGDQLEIVTLVGGG